MKFWVPQKRKFKLLAWPNLAEFGRIWSNLVDSPDLRGHFHYTPRLGVPFLSLSFLMNHPYGENAVGKKFKLFLS